MGKKAVSGALTLVLLVVVAAAAAAAGAEDTWKLCNMTRDGLTACRPAIAGSTSQKPAPGPTAACCTALSNADLNCLCGYKNSGLLGYFGVDPDLAMQLPAKCNVPAPNKC